MARTRVAWGENPEITCIEGYYSMSALYRAITNVIRGYERSNCIIHSVTTRWDEDGTFDAEVIANAKDPA